MSDDSHHDSSPYLALKIAQAMFRKSLDALTGDERRRVEAIVARQADIEERILATPEAASVVLTPDSIDAAWQEIRARYASDEAFEAALGDVGLAHAGLRAAIERSLRVDAVLERVGGAVDISETDVELFYLVHRERFVRPERRTVRHILITINDDFKGNRRANARWRIENVLRRAQKAPERFAELATRHSECPTALNGGLVGTVRRGMLYAELDRAAFALGAGQVSPIVESENGFHIVQCVAIEPAATLSLGEVAARIRQSLAEAKRQSVQKQWIETLIGKAA
jgi:peptidylprolyl isomerase/peptidyl-prolyl cis-trans isomerase C